MENDIVRVRVLSLGALLAAGFVPDAGFLRHKNGASLNQGLFTSHSGKVLKGLGTGNAQYPVTLDGVIYPADALSLEVQKHEYKAKDGSKRELIRFDDGALALDLNNGSTPEVLSVEVISAVHADGKKAARKE